MNHFFLSCSMELILLGGVLWFLSQGVSAGARGYIPLWGGGGAR